MSKPCSVCTSAYRDSIDKALVNGMSLRELEETYHLSKSALSRHRAEHINVALIKAAPAEVVASNASLTDQLKDVHAKTMRILQDAEVMGDPRVALVAIREARSNLETLAKIEMVLAGRGGSGTAIDGRVHIYLPDNGRNHKLTAADLSDDELADIAAGDDSWREELEYKICGQVEREVLAILDGQEIGFEGAGPAGKMAIGQAIAVLRKMCEAAGITAENVKEKAKQACVEAVTQNHNFATGQKNTLDGNGGVKNAEKTG